MLIQREIAVKYSMRCIIAGVALTLCAGSATAQSRIEVGVLTCQGGESTSFVVGSTQSFLCAFRPAVGNEQVYDGVIRRAGIDIGKTHRTTLVWTILAPSRDVKAGELAGNYAGISAGATAGVGGGVNLLVGGSNSSIALQPLSIEGETGLSITASITAFELRSR